MQSLFRTVLGGRELPLLARAGPLLQIPSIRLGISLQWPWSWSGLFEAAPKKRSSHQKKRQRQLAGNNQIKPLRNLNRCPACGHVKRAHTLCMHCVKEIRKTWRVDEAARREPRGYDESRLSKEDTEFNYPSRINQPSEYERKLANKSEYVLSRPRTLEARPRAPKAKNLPQLLRKPYRD